MKTLKRISLLIALGAALAVAGCGGGDDEGDPIPAEQAEALNAQLDNIQARLDEGSAGACRDVFSHPTDPNRPRVEETLTSIPDGVDPEVRSALERSFANLWELVESECEQRARQEEDARQAKEPEPQPEPIPTETDTPTETVPPEETTPPEEEVLPPEGDGDNGGAIPGDPGGGVGPGNGNGNGNGNAFGTGGD